MHTAAYLYYSSHVNLRLLECRMQCISWSSLPCLYECTHCLLWAVFCFVQKDELLA